MAKRRGGRRHKSKVKNTSLLCGDDEESSHLQNGEEGEEEEGEGENRRSERVEDEVLQKGGGIVSSKHSKERHGGDDDEEDAHHLSSSQRKTHRNKSKRGEDEDAYPHHREERYHTEEKQGGRGRQEGERTIRKGDLTYVEEEEIDRFPYSSSENQMKKKELQPKKDRAGTSDGNRTASSSGSGSFSEYFAHIKQVIEQKPFKSDEEWEIFITATAEEIASKASLVLTDQKCSKVVEKILGLLTTFVSSRSSSQCGDSRDTERESRCIDAFVVLLRKIAGCAGQLAVHMNGSHVLQTLLASLPAILSAEGRLKEAKARTKDKNGEEKHGDDSTSQSVEDLALYCLHTMQSENGGWVSLMYHHSGSHIFRAAIRACAGIYALPSVEELGRRKPRKGRFQTSEALGFVGSAAPSSSCPSSVSRDGSTGFGGKGQEGPPVQVMDIPSSFRSLLKNVTKDVVSSLVADRYTLLFDVYASPALQSLLFVLNHIGLEKEKQNILAAIFFGQQGANMMNTSAGDMHSQRAEMVQLGDALIDSATGSRLLEVAIPLLGPAEFQVFFSSWVIKRIDHLAQGRFGNFVLQKLLAAPIVQAAHVRQAVGGLDFQGCLAVQTPAVLWRLSEACRRVREGSHDFARKLFNALDLLQNPRDSVDYAWVSLLSLKRPNELPEWVRKGTGGGAASSSSSTDARLSSESTGGENQGDGGEGKKRKELREKTSHLSSANSNPGALGQHNATGALRPAELRRLGDILTPTGVSLALSLLKFPSKSIQPLVVGFKKFLKFLRRGTVMIRKWQAREKSLSASQKENSVSSPVTWEESSLFFQMAIDPQGSRLLEALVKGVGIASKKSGNSSRGEKGRNEESQDADSLSEQGLLPHASIQQLIRSFQGHYAKAALHPRGGFVVTAFYNTAEIELKRRIVRELLEVEDDLKETNYATYVACEVYKFKQNEEAWTTRQEKRSKTRELFKDLLGDEEQQEEEALEEETDGRDNHTSGPSKKKTDLKGKDSETDPSRKAEKAIQSLISGDSVAQQLLEMKPGDEQSNAAGEQLTRKQKEKRGKKKKTLSSTSDNDSDVDDAPNSYLRGAQTNPEDMREAMADLFPEEAGEEKKKKKKKREKDLDYRISCDDQHEETGGDQAPAAFCSSATHEVKKKRKRKDEQREEDEDHPAEKEEKENDPTLEAALYFIEGTRKGISQRQLAKRRKVEAAKVKALTEAPVEVH
ncbi:nucleolar protein 9 [Cystoisospora suis]|uniref:Nucleolar protein 9 n=1 Tax=Cystoisospora suis TaxID=483139 RepID=A0A2C6KJA9_9APIC|nr:nucleolar protein 9 [Cystoisospora suis]